MEISANRSSAPPGHVDQPSTPPLSESGAVDMIAGCSTLPSLPAAYLRLMEAMNDPYSSSEDFAKIIELDPSLTARVLRVVNSPLYRPSTAIDSMATAMSFLGIGPLHDLVLATSAIDVFNNIPPDLIDMGSFWRHSLGTAVVSRSIGTVCGHPDAEKLFVIGLLHDIGRLAMCLAEPALTRRLMTRARESDNLLLEIERSEMGFDHAMLGRELLRAWGLPRSLNEPVGCHHDPGASREHQRDAAILHVADVTAHALFFGSSGERLIPPLSASAWSLVKGDWCANRMFRDVDFAFQVAQQVVLH